MRISRSRLYLRVPEQSTNHRQILAELKSVRCEGVAKIMDTKVVQSSAFAQATPGLLHVSKVLTFNIAGDHIGVVLGPRYGLEHLDCRLAYGH